MCDLNTQVPLWWWRLQRCFAEINSDVAHTQSPAPGHISRPPGQLGLGSAGPKGRCSRALRNAMKEKGLWSLPQVFWLHGFVGCSHNPDLETYFSTDSMVRFKGSLATVKIDHFPKKAAAGLCSFPNSSTWAVLCLPLLSDLLACSPHMADRPFSLPHQQLSCTCSHFLSSLLKQLKYLHLSQACIGKQSFRSS